MSKYHFIMLLIIVTFACTSRNEIRQSDAIESAVIMPVVENDEDTILNGSIFKTKVYLTRDSLYKVALSNGINDYLDIRYAEHKDPTDYYSRATKIPKMNGDTALIEFGIDIPNLSSDEIIEYQWQTDFNIDFKKNSSPVDTTFIYRCRLYIKGKS